MPSSDSEDFESADEGNNSIIEKKCRKKRTSSNYSDSTVELEPGSKPVLSTCNPKDVNKENADGWDDFEIEEESQITQLEKSSYVNSSHTMIKHTTTVEEKKQESKQDTGWDDFDDWGDFNDPAKENSLQTSVQNPPEQNIKEVTERLAATSTSTGWGWGWGVDSILSTATAGISNLTSQVSQGISTVLETGIGAPDPEELARQRINETESKSVRLDDGDKPDRKVQGVNESEVTSSDASFPFGNIFSGVTKFVETTGTKVLNSGLDTLETIGKKTMEVLQDGDPGLAKKRAMLGLDHNDKPVLSQVLREAKARADEEDKIREEKREAKEVHYENLFDDFEGLVHLEALEMLSRQVNMRIEERLRGADPAKRQDIKETLQQVAELCEMPEEDDDEEDAGDGCKPDLFLERLQSATQDLGIKLHFQALVKQYTEILDWQSAENDNLTEKLIFKKAVSGLAQATALSVEIYHKAAEMLLVKTRRSTADESDALTQLTVVLTKHVSELATLFTERLNSLPSGDKELVNSYITNIFLEAGNSSTYIQNAFQLALPILQIGAV